LTHLKVTADNILKPFKRYEKKDLVNELENMERVNTLRINNPILLIGLFEKFGRFELGGLLSNACDLPQILIHFFYLQLLENPEKPNEINKNKTFFDCKYCMKMTPPKIFRDPIKEYLDAGNYLSNAFLIEPGILLNLRVPKPTERKFTEFSHFSKKSEIKKMNIFSLLMDKEIKELVMALIKKPHIFRNEILDQIENNDSYLKIFRKLIKPIVILVNKIVEIDFDLKKKEFNENFIKFVMDCYQ